MPSARRPTGARPEALFQPPPERQPLAARMRPRNLDEFVGQAHLVGERGPLRRSIARGHLASLLLWGPPGTGKTSLARLLAGEIGAHFTSLSAVMSGVADVRSTIAEAQDRLNLHGTRSVLFLDEIHRFNKAQQDALLPAVEDGTLTLIGATTENPYFEVNSALLSRAQVYELRPLEPGQVEELLRRALADRERGIADPPAIAPAALEMLALRSGGDARVALSALERAVERANGEVDVAAVEDALQRKAIDYDRAGDRHYDFVSAWIKATRGSDVDASLYYLAVMLEGGEDPRFIARRMVILASEDVGNADPQALLVADAAARAVDRVGLPECALNLAQAAVYLALAPKSNASYKALSVARAEVRANGAKTPPDYLRDAHYPGAEKLGRGEGYRYAHDEPGAVSDQPLLPAELHGRRFYEPTDRGFEIELGERLAALRKQLDNS
ncbi:MAG TPA: replication-associated recombination protein A [Solirubrobacterales bacterium]|nr:replication-associated recombination protein A [Solirubrobacterales bacterium]